MVNNHMKSSDFIASIYIKFKNWQTYLLELLKFTSGYVLERIAIGRRYFGGFGVLKPDGMSATFFFTVLSLL